MDVEEATRQYQKLLGRLNMSTKSIELATQFFTSHKQYSDHLLSCITDTMSKERLSVRVNITYYLKDLCAACSGTLPIKDWLHKDIKTIVDRGVPTNLGPTALANVEPMKRALELLQEYLDPQVYAGANAILDSKICSEQELQQPIKLSKDDIMKRMEEDRERTKRIKEDKWKVVGDKEFDYLWDLLGGLSELDRQKMRLQNELAQTSRS